MEEAFRALLLADAGVAALAGSRVDFGEALDTSGPYVVLWVIGDAAGHTLTGSDGLTRGRIQADCYALGYPEAKRLSRAVRDALDAHQGGGFRSIFHDATREDREGGGNETKRPYRISLDFLTHWRADHA
ncbi:DUF3168 domain-containing protein [Limimaricola cinnabarinus]|uniref:DUF3168 domain-containing protein n=1 Tax=Limimaricola cinnabarinus LL-001 TaxID=1337093 RepID=U2Z286_9RHOB|nr:DUF3168 domain-containing protein [Limimaricola cinnabarinus]GAD55490.1 hypothetical protein MBELCI_1542 [Limimaricola cinnabarinus LL-001]